MAKTQAKMFVYLFVTRVTRISTISATSRPRGYTSGACRHNHLSSSIIFIFSVILSQYLLPFLLLFSQTGRPSLDS